MGLRWRWKRVKISLSISNSVIFVVVRMTDKNFISFWESTIKVSGKRISK